MYASKVSSKLSVARLKTTRASKKLKLGVVIPALNEAGAIADTLKQVQSILRNYKLSVVVIDGGSTDNTVQIVQNLGIPVVRQSREGYGDALSTGFEYISQESGPEILVMLDADGTYDPKDIPGMLQPLVAREADIVLGNRFPRSEPGSMTAVNRFGNHLISWLTGRLFGVEVSDTQCGMRAFFADLVPLFKGQATGMSYATEMLIDAHQAGARIAERDIAYKPRIGKTKLNPFKDGASILGIILRLLRDYKPLLFFGGLGLAFMVCGLIFGFAALREWILFGRVTKTATAILAALLMIMGVQFFSIGLVADMIKGVRSQVRSQERAWIKRMLLK